MKQDYRCIIAGSRNYFNFIVVCNKCEFYLQNKLKSHNVIILSGGAYGVDNMGEKFAALHNLDCELFPADWNKYGKAAGPIRNALMAERADALIAFWDGKSLGTKSMIKLAREKDLDLAVIRIDKL